MNTHSKAYLISLQLYADCCNRGQLRKVTFEQYSETGYEKVDTGHKERFIPEQITIVDHSLFTSNNLSHRAEAICCKMIGELCLNNALWYFDHTLKRQDKAAIAELRDKGILLRTEDPRIHYVNPDRIRRGSKPAVLMCTTKELEGVKRVTTDNIRNLGTNRASTNLLDMTSLPPSQTTQLKAV